MVMTIMFVSNCCYVVNIIIIVKELSIVQDFKTVITIFFYKQVLNISTTLLYCKRS